ncbi:MAG: uncharacterized protein KVP18_003515 [Porospora cf. gigantea A]|uniref:uncharacterized protein n=3 Tax=Porospora cf. gigantea A TaxID=2853593 RepID=UPI003559A398|nr:MAG: hypothetical protein KVP18_003515 [Porospora cf. gigantea A]
MFEFEDATGITVNFPVEPYDCQKQFVHHVLRALISGTCAALESPTGTGKTLSLVCAALAWQRAARAGMPMGGPSPVTAADPFDGCLELITQGDDVRLMGEPVPSRPEVRPLQRVGKVIYTSRTHTQLRQVSREVKRAGYAVRCVTLGSRDQYCVNQQVRSAKEKNAACRRLLGGRGCPFNVDIKCHQAAMTGECLDVEDLRQASAFRCYDAGGQQVEVRPFCPYFFAKEAAAQADVVLMPYNYLLQPELRAAFDVDGLLKGAVVVVDEGHNLAGWAEEAASFSLSAEQLDETCAALGVVMSLIQASNKKRTVNGAQVAELLLQPIATISSALKTWTPQSMTIKLASGESLIPLDDSLSVIHEPHAVFAGDCVLRLIQAAGWTRPNVSQGSLRQLLQRVRELVEDSEDVDQQALVVESLQSLQVLLNLVFLTTELYTAGMKVVVRWTATSRRRVSLLQSARASACPRLDVYCLTGAVAVLDLLREVRSLIVASGTLPFETLQEDLFAGRKKIDVTFQGPHILEPDQLTVLTLAQGRDGYQILGSRNHVCRHLQQHYDNVGRILDAVATKLVDKKFGVLVFFSSYSQMTEGIQQLLASRFISSRKVGNMPVLVEARKSLGLATQVHEITDAAHLLTDLRRCLATASAFVFCVIRGLLSEGTDFMGDLARGAVVLGVPYPNLMSTKVHLKRQQPHGEAWYDQQAIQAVNQAVGRIIRSREDFGFVILADSRYESARYYRRLSEWIRRSLKRQEARHISSQTSFSRPGKCSRYGAGLFE